MSSKKTTPNTLIIYIKTRIPNHYKINYEPSMTVPKSKSTSLYFDPLVEYYTAPIKNIPTPAPPETIYTQFFEANEFDFLINRILSNFRYMQKARTLEEATQQGIIDNNIQLTLNTLFQPNNLFYIDKKPYTIINYNWKQGNWQIDTKPIDKLITPFSHLTGNALEEAEKEKNEIPESIRQGNAVSATLVQDELASNITQITTPTTETTEKEKETEIKPIQPLAAHIPFIKNTDLLDKMPESYKKLYGKFLQRNTPINYSDKPDIIRDPLSLSLLIEQQQLNHFLEKNTNSEIIKLYNNYINSKTLMNKADEDYITACTELAIFKKIFNDYSNKTSGKLREIIKEIKTTNTEPITGGAIDVSKFTNDATKKKANILIKTLHENKITYMELLFKLVESLMNIYEKQSQYFVSLKLLLEAFKNDYVNIIQYYKTPLLAIKCIDFDISTINALLEEDPENPYSVSYFNNLNRFKKFYETSLKQNEQELLNPQINYLAEYNNYLSDPGILFMEKFQYELYSFRTFLYFSYNQFDIWTLYYKSIELFVKQILDYSNEQLNLTKSFLNNYNTLYNEQQQLDFLERNEVTGLAATYSKKDKQFNWMLVRKDGKRAVNEAEGNKKYLLTPYNINDDKKQEKTYIDLIKAEADSYDCIMLYIYLLEIQCLRQNNLYTAEENVNQLNVETTVSFKYYYEAIKRSIEEYQFVQIFVPPSIMWETNELNNIDVLNDRIENNDKAFVVYRNRISEIHKSITNLVMHCEAIYDAIYPTISQDGFLNTCYKILIKNLSDLPTYTSRSSYWLNLSIKNYDITHTNNLIYNLDKVVTLAYND